MLLIRRLLWMIFLKTCQSIECFGERTFNLSLSEATLENVQKIFDQHSTVEMFACESFLIVDPLSKYLIITLDPWIFAPDYRRTTSSVIFGHIFTKIEFTNAKNNLDKTSLKTGVNLLCYHRDRCDRSLILHFIRLIIDFTYDDLIRNVYPLILVSGAKNKTCMVSEKMQIEECRGSGCYWRRTHGDQLSQSDCVESTDLPRYPLLKLSTRIHLHESLINHTENKSSNQSYDYQLIDSMMNTEFWCEFNHCNDETNGKIIDTTVLDHYVLWNRWNDFFTSVTIESAEEGFEDEISIITTTEMSETFETEVISTTDSLTSSNTITTMATSTSQTLQTTSTTITTTKLSSSGNISNAIEKFWMSCLLMFYLVQTDSYHRSLS